MCTNNHEYCRSNLHHNKHLCVFFNIVIIPNVGMMAFVNIPQGMHLAWFLLEGIWPQL
jgi:hypothetical protein